MTDFEQHLYKNLIAAKTKISKCQNMEKRNSIKLRTLNELFFNEQFLDSMGKWSTAIQMLTTMHCLGDKNIAEKFTIEEKFFALTMLTRSPRAYVFLSKSFTLPEPQYLFKLFKKSAPKTEINENALHLLQTGLQNLKKGERICALVFDEMKLKPNLCCDNDNISGLVTYGVQTKNLLADHAQLYMIRGLVRTFKLPIAYTLTSGPIKGHDLARQIKGITTQLQSLGIQIVALVSDEASNNLQALRILKAKTRRFYCRNNQTPKENIIIINSQEIVPIFDPPHLLQEIRNNLLTKDLKHTLQKAPGTAKWDHIRTFYNKFGVIKLKGLTEECVEPSEESKRQVLNAIQMLSQTIALHIITAAGYGSLPKECCETGYLIYFFNNLFDSVNGTAYSSKSNSPLLQQITAGSVHHKTWVQAQNELANMTFISKDGHEVNVPTLNNWITTIVGIETLAEKLREEHRVNSLWPRSLNMDPLVSFIETIENECPNSTPTVQEFEKAFIKYLLPPRSFGRIRHETK